MDAQVEGDWAPGSVDDGDGLGCDWLVERVPPNAAEPILSIANSWFEASILYLRPGSNGRAGRGRGRAAHYLNIFTVLGVPAPVLLFLHGLVHLVKPQREFSCHLVY